jgi:hypothetical protein
MTYKFCPWVVFPSWKRFVKEILLNLVDETISTYVVHALVDYLSATYTCDLWMSKGARDVFVVVVNFISSDWEAKHVMIRLFEVTNTSGVAMVSKLQKLLNKFSLTTMFFVYVKDKGSNFQACASALTFVVSCEFFSLFQLFDGSHSRHALLKVCQYAITDEKVAIGLHLSKLFNLQF